MPAVESFIDTDQKYLQHDSGANRDDGCTAVTAVLLGNKLVVANVGDSRAVLSRGGKGANPIHLILTFPLLCYSLLQTLSKISTPSQSRLRLVGHTGEVLPKCMGSLLGYPA